MMGLLLLLRGIGLVVRLAGAALARDGVVEVFVSSRRRHTRSTRDWSSDVCSSDLAHTLPYTFVPTARSLAWYQLFWMSAGEAVQLLSCVHWLFLATHSTSEPFVPGVMARTSQLALPWTRASRRVPPATISTSASTSWSWYGIPIQAS